MSAPDRRYAEILELREQHKAMERRSRWAERDVRRLTRLLDLAIKGCLDEPAGEDEAFKSFVVALAEWREGRARRAVEVDDREELHRQAAFSAAIIGNLLPSGFELYLSNEALRGSTLAVLRDEPNGIRIRLGDETLGEWMKRTAPKEPSHA